jgi:S-adenosylmethionine:tRNA-ribosyltransferase-isomerase (queuine synthetase)
MNSADRNLSAYDYVLPPGLIAQNPAEPRDSSRLLVVSPTRQIEHRYFWQLPDWLEAGDLLVFNNTKVIPARLYGRKSTGAEVEVLLLEDLGSDRWLGLVKPGRTLPVGSEIVFAGMRAVVQGIDPETHARELQFSPEGDRTFGKS